MKKRKKKGAAVSIASVGTHPITASSTLKGKKKKGQAVMKLTTLGKEKDQRTSRFRTVLRPRVLQPMEGEKGGTKKKRVIR